MALGTTVAQQPTSPALQPPTPSAGEIQQPPKQIPAEHSAKAETDQRGTEQSPLVVKTLSAPKSQLEATQDAQDREEKTTTDRWMISLTGVLAIIAAIQTRVFWVQANRLKDTIVKMGEIADGQTADMKTSIDQATRAGSAMEKVAEAMSANVEIVRGVAATNKELADRQSKLWPMQMRAYITVIVGTATYQDIKNNIKFAAGPEIVNTGNTPAHKVTHRINAAILNFPIDDSFTFPTIAPSKISETVVGPAQRRSLHSIVKETFPEEEVPFIKEGVNRALCVWGTVTYDDVFEVSHYTNFCQILTWLKDGRIYGYYHPYHNDSD